MPDRTRDTALDRRSFLRGSALFAAAFGLSAAWGAAQEPQEKPTPPPADPFGDEEPSSRDEPETKIDRDGREYRVCPQCGANMYRYGRTWTCETCGYSYVE